VARGARKLDRPAFGGPRGLNRKGGSREPLTDNGRAVRASAGGPFADQAKILCQNRRYDDSLAALRHAHALAAAEPRRDQLTSALVYLAQGKPETARRNCAADRNSGQPLCLAIAPHQLGRLAEAKDTLANLRAAMGNTGLMIMPRYTRNGAMGPARSPG
jgi:hypothetical protein